jgi:LDH2 family malate/lactate/ureidoglycolate dehydrogenase
VNETLRRAKSILQTSGALWASSLMLDRIGIPALRLWPEFRVVPEILANQIRAILNAWGVPEADISIIVEHLMYADLHGIDSHGCAMLLQYYRDITAGRLSADPHIKVICEGPATAVVDGGGGFGHLAGDAAMKVAIKKCRDVGIAAVSVWNSNHYGAAGSYALMATRSGLIGIAMTGTAEPAMVPTFGLSATLGTNPIAFAAPAVRNRPFLLDMATSTVPLGRLMTAWRNGNPIPEGWALDNRGHTVTDARLAAGYRKLTPLGSTREMGSHKGYGLAAMVEILCSLLSSGSFRGNKAKPHHGVDHFCLAIDPKRFRAPGEFETDLDAMMESLRNSEPADPKKQVKVAGDPEHEAYEERSRSGIPIARSVVEDLRFVCRNSRVNFILGDPARPDHSQS